jgi:hypothetical protein
MLDGARISAPEPGGSHGVLAIDFRLAGDVHRILRILERQHQRG